MQGLNIMNFSLLTMMRCLAMHCFDVHRSDVHWLQVESGAFLGFLSGQMDMRACQNLVLHALAIILSFGSQFLVQN